MKAEELRNALLAVGLLEEEINKLTLSNAKKIYISKVNDMVPEGSEEEPDIDENLVRVYNRLDEEEIEDWTEPTSVQAKTPAPRVRKKDPADYKKRGPKPKDKSFIPPKTETSPNFRGRSVKHSRAECVIEALRIGGTRDDILVMADKLFVKKGGGSNFFQTTTAYMDSMRVLKALNLVSYNGGRVILKKFTIQ